MGVTAPGVGKWGLLTVSSHARIKPGIFDTKRNHSVTLSLAVNEGRKDARFILVICSSSEKELAPFHATEASKSLLLLLLHVLRMDFSTADVV